MSEIFNNLKSILRTPTPQALPVIGVSGPADYNEVPNGFFRVLTKSGTKSIGYKCANFLCWDVRGFVVDGATRVPVPEKIDALPLVCLNYTAPSAVQRVGDVALMNTDTEEWDGIVDYDGDQKHRKESSDAHAQLDSQLWER